VLIANSHLVPRWANWDEFRRLEQMGLTMYGQMTAGSWIYIGTQGILQGTFETFAECARQHFDGTLDGRLVVTAGLGEMGAASADHLEHASAEGIAAMAEAGVVAVSLPLATLYLDEEPLPAVAFHDAGVPLAVATDFNPGTAPGYHLPLALMLACTLQRMTPAQALAGATRHAAAAFHRADEIGSLAPGMQADFVLLNAPSLSHWLYHFRPNATVATYVQGRRWPE